MECLLPNRTHTPPQLRRRPRAKHTKRFQMVTKEFAQGLGITVASVVGLLVGFKVQDEVARRREVRGV